MALVRSDRQIAVDVVTQLSSAAVRCWLGLGDKAVLAGYLAL
jgi:hypothetical protein